MNKNLLFRTLHPYEKLILSFLILIIVFLFPLKMTIVSMLKLLLILGITVSLSDLKKNRILFTVLGGYCLLFIFLIFLVFLNHILSKNTISILSALRTEHIILFVKGMSVIITVFSLKNIFQNNEIWYLLKTIKCPDYLSSLLFIIIRSFQDIENEFKCFILACTSRNLKVRRHFSRNRYTKLKNIFSGMFFRVLRKGERIEKALAARDFKGKIFTIYLPAHRRISDVLFTLSLIVILLLIAYL